MKTISEIYSEYKIKKNLQEHMFRVASVASLICDSIELPVAKDKIIYACLFHDIGNIAKIQLDYFPELNIPEGLEYWQKVKDEFIRKYGINDHDATLKIMRELDIPEDIIYLVDNVGHILFCSQLEKDDVNVKIINYADTRVGPFGVLSYDKRMHEVSIRYKQYKNFIGDEKHEQGLKCGKDIEKQIFSHCNIEPEDINDESIKPYMEKLKDFVIK